MNTPEIISSLKQNEIFVYGSNQFAIHGAGSAKTANDKFGAVYRDCPMGLCGNSYGIITTSFTKTSIEIDFIKIQVTALYHFAALRPDLKFYVTKIGTGLAGFTIKEIASVFKSQSFKCNNIILPEEFKTKKL